jgi:hypothetical protein
VDLRPLRRAPLHHTPSPGWPTRSSISLSRLGLTPDYYVPRINGIPDESANTFWLRLVTPFWRVIPRISLPIQVVPAPSPSATVAKVSGDSNKPKTQFIAAQPFLFLQLGKGYYVRSAPIWFFDIEQPTYNVPVGLGAGKVIPTEKVIFNLLIEPPFAMALRGIGQPAVQIFAGINMQFKTGRKKKNQQAASLVNQLQAEQSLRSQMQ